MCVCRVCVCVCVCVCVLYHVCMHGHLYGRMTKRLSVTITAVDGCACVYACIDV